jgi:hypothetical protein
MSWAADVKIHHQSFGGEAEEWTTWTDDDGKTRRVPIRELFDGESRCNLEKPRTESVTCGRLAGHDGPHVELDYARELSFVIAP